MVKIFSENIIKLIEKYLHFDARYFMHGGFWLIVGQIITLGLGLVTTVVFAYYLSATDYGIYRYLLGLAVIFSALSLTGIDQSILQTAAKKYFGFYRETVKINFLYNGAVFVSALAGAGYYFYNENITLAIGCILIAILQPLVNTFQFVPAFLQGSRRFKESTILHGIRTTFVSLVSLLALLFTNNILVLLFVYLLSTALTNAFSYWFYRPTQIDTTPRDVFKKYLNYAKHTSARNFISTIAFRADSVLVFTQLGAVELAFYTIAIVIPEQIKGTFKSLATLLLPKYANYSNIEDIIKSIPLRSFQFFLILSAISVAYIIVAPLLYKIVFPKYEEVILYTQIIALSFPAMVALIPINALQSQLKEKDLYILNTLSSIIMIISTYTGIIFYGLMGAVLAKVFYRYAVAIITYIIIYNKPNKQI